MGDIEDLRLYFRQQRANIIGDQREKLSRQATINALNYIEKYSDIRDIGVFLSLNEEIDTQYLIQALWDRGYQLYLPVVQARHQPLIWRRYQRNDPLEKDILGMKVPHQSAQTKPPSTPKLIITPLVAYNNDGYRIGMGGGFYDRSFANKRKNTAPYLMGFSYQCQNCVKINPNPWDICLDAIANEAEFVFFH